MQPETRGGKRRRHVLPLLSPAQVAEIRKLRLLQVPYKTLRRYSIAAEQRWIVRLWDVRLTRDIYEHQNLGGAHT